MRIKCLHLALLCLLIVLTASAQQTEPDIQDDTQDTSETESVETQTKRFQPSERIKADDQVYFPVDI